MEFIRLSKHRTCETTESDLYIGTCESENLRMFDNRYMRIKMHLNKQWIVIWKTADEFCNNSIWINARQRKEIHFKMVSLCASISYTYTTDVVKIVRKVPFCDDGSVFIDFLNIGYWMHSIVELFLYQEKRAKKKVSNFHTFLEFLRHDHFVQSGSIDNYRLPFTLHLVNIPYHLSFPTQRLRHKTFSSMLNVCTLCMFCYGKLWVYKLTHMYMILWRKEHNNMCKNKSSIGLQWQKNSAEQWISN